MRAVVDEQRPLIGANSPYVGTLCGKNTKNAKLAGELAFENMIESIEQENLLIGPSFQQRPKIIKLLVKLVI